MQVKLSHIVTIEFAPTSAETYSGVVNLSGGGGTSVAVSGSGSASGSGPSLGCRAGAEQGESANVLAALFALALYLATQRTHRRAR